MKQTQSEVRDPTASPTGHITVDPAMHEPVRFDRASEVYEALNLSHIGCDTTHPTPANSKLAPCLPENPIPGDVPIDPVHTGSANAAPSSPTATQPIQSTLAPSQPTRAAPAPSKPIASAPASHNLAPPKCTITLFNGDMVPCTRTPTTSAPSDRNPTAPVPINRVLIDPDPGDVAPNPAGAIASIDPAFTSAVPVDPNLVSLTHPKAISVKPKLRLVLLVCPAIQCPLGLSLLGPVSASHCSNR